MTRRQLIRHGAWFGAAVVLTVAGGEVISHVAGSAGAAQSAKPALRFAQISDSHIGFNGPANHNVTDTFTQAIGQINGLGFTLTMGAGTWAGNSISENLSYKHFLNTTRLARVIPPRVPTEEQLWGQYVAKHGR